MGKSNINIKYKCLGAGSGNVTGSMHTLEIKVNNVETKILLDVGALQDSKHTSKRLFELNRMDMDMSDIEHIICSHSHLDHIQNLCQVQRLDFDGIIYMTEPTLELAEHITLDGIKIHDKTVEYLSKISKRKVIPYMNLRSREYFLNRVHAYGYNRWIQINENIKFKFLEAGHISGGSMILIEVHDGYEKETILYTGDTSCGRSVPFTAIPNIEKLKINHVITESTYAHVNIPQRKEETIIEDLYRMIKSSCKDKGGKLLLPSFAMARSTNIAYYMKKTYDKYPELNDVPIYMASPLMNKCHKTISNYFSFYDDNWSEYKDLFSWKNISNLSEFKDVETISKRNEPQVWISSSGMADKGVNSYLVSEIVKSRKNTICFVGYCAEGTTGHKLINGNQKTITSSIDGEKKTVIIRAKVENLTGMSSHASGDEIVEMLRTAEQKKLKTVIAVHGDKDRTESMCELFQNKYKQKLNTYSPRIGQSIKL